MFNSVNIVSPHQDDAALSLGLSIRRWLKRRLTVNIVNCFTVTRWAPFSEAKSVVEVMRIRHLEDLAFAERCGGHVNFLDLGALDSPLRLKACDTKAIFAAEPFSSQDDATIADLVVRLNVLVPEGVILAPLAARDHIDHRIAQEACCVAFGGRPLVFYEDLPYAAQISPNCLYDYVLEIEERTAENLVLCMVEGTASDSDKASLVSVYASQLEPSDYETLHRIADAGERLWLPKNQVGLVSLVLGT